MGDVCGKGPEAAALTALARHTVRATALSLKEPDEILRKLNDALLAQVGGERFCTVVLGTLDPASARMTIACGGHPLPLVLRNDGTLESAGRNGMLVGLFDEVLTPTGDVQLHPGDTIVFYTDGITEARAPDDRVIGEAGLREILASCAGLDAGTIAARLEHAAIDFQKGEPHDDVAVLVLRMFPTDEPQHSGV
jgi:serine phosphatase RsbU (regulator of sigma subunit)